MSSADADKRIHELEADQAKRVERARLYMNKIGELEAERDDYKERARMCLELQEVAETERDAIRDELHKIASFIEPHWQGAGAKLEAAWIIRVISEMNSEADAIRAETFAECAKIADSFTCGCCGMDGKSGDAIRAKAQKTESGE